MVGSFWMWQGRPIAQPEGLSNFPRWDALQVRRRANGP